jgi:hypothetical protein
MSAKLDKEIERQADEYDRYQERGKYAVPYEGEDEDSDRSFENPSIEISGCRKLTEVQCMGTERYGVEYMSLSNCPNLTTIHMNKGISIISVYNCPNLTTIYSSDGSDYSGCVIDVVQCPKLTTIYPNDNLRSISIDQCPSLLIEQVPVDCTKPGDILYPKTMTLKHKYTDISIATEDGPPMVYRLLSAEQ